MKGVCVCACVRARERERLHGALNSYQNHGTFFFYVNTAKYIHSTVHTFFYVDVYILDHLEISTKSIINIIRRWFSSHSTLEDGFFPKLIIQNELGD